MTLDLVGVPATVWFTDRPARKSGVEETATFTQAWSASSTFAKQAPNGVLEGRVHGVRRVLPVQLTQARYSPDTATVHYTVRPLPRAPSFYRGSAASSRLGPGPLGSSSLFIDDAGVPRPGCWVQWTIPNVVQSGGGNTWAGLQIDSGGTFSYSFGEEIGAFAGSTLYSFVAPGGNIAATGPEQWGAQPNKQFFQGDGMGGGTLHVLTWFEPSPGAQKLTGEVFGTNSPPVADAPPFRWACQNVQVSTNGPNYPFTVTFSSNT
jgi:hypothetical protein